MEHCGGLSPLGVEHFRARSIYLAGCLPSMNIFRFQSILILDRLLFRGKLVGVVGFLVPSDCFKSFMSVYMRKAHTSIVIVDFTHQEEKSI